MQGYYYEARFLLKNIRSPLSNNLILPKLLKDVKYLLEYENVFATNVYFLFLSTYTHKNKHSSIQQPNNNPTIVNQTFKNYVYN